MNYNAIGLGIGAFFVVWMLVNDFTYGGEEGGEGSGGYDAAAALLFLLSLPLIIALVLGGAAIAIAIAVLVLPFLALAWIIRRMMQKREQDEQAREARTVRGRLHALSEKTKAAGRAVRDRARKLLGNAPDETSQALADADERWRARRPTRDDDDAGRGFALGALFHRQSRDASEQERRFRDESRSRAARIASAAEAQDAAARAETDDAGAHRHAGGHAGRDDEGRRDATAAAGKMRQRWFARRTRQTDEDEDGADAADRTADAGKRHGFFLFLPGSRAARRKDPSSSPAGEESAERRPRRMLPAFLRRFLGRVRHAAVQHPHETHDEVMRRLRAIGWHTRGRLSRQPRHG